MTGVTAANPWVSKESKLNFVDIDCGNATKSVTLNQTNYAIQSFNNGKGTAGATNTLTTPSTFIRLTDATAKTFRIKSNAAWKTTIANPSTIFSHTIPATGGADITNGTTPPNSDYALTGIAGIGTKYQTATILIEDTSSPKRAKDVTVTCYSCIGTANLTGLQPETFGNSNRADWATAWGTKVIHHQAKAGVYEEFTSADFGAAGRWMTTNLSAKAYDGNPNPHRSLTGPNGKGNYNTAYWAYPNIGGANKPLDATEYNKNKSLGLLYTWDAATAGKGGINGTTQFGAAPNYSESGLPEGTGAGQQKRIQGICPSGWHLPSDYEWTVLEQEMIKQTTTYAHVSQNIHDQYPTELATVPQNTNLYAGWRGSYHGKAMKEVCETYNTDPVGTSKPAIQGGFSAPLAGFAYSGSSYVFGLGVYFWSSSSLGAYDAWCRYLGSHYGGVGEDGYDRSHLFSVRCKKDNSSI